ncbi:MAG: FHA domain-containing protein [Acidobacteria bacterium]|nr:FHA domain-containing protein [Acidobacteriota bacterium]
MKRCSVCQREYPDITTFCNKDGTKLDPITQDPQARLLIHSPDGDEREVVLTSAIATIGKTPDNTVIIPGETISRKHAQIQQREGQYFIRDLGSRNGTFLNGNRLGEDELPLQEGDEIAIGRSGTMLRFLLEPIISFPDTVDLSKVKLERATMLEPVSIYPQARLYITDSDGGEREVPLTSAFASIGKTPDNLVVIADEAISRKQSQIEQRDGQYLIRDLGSRNGTFLNGTRLGEDESPLHEGDEITIGLTKIRFHLEAVSSQPEITELPKVETAVALPVADEPAPTPIPQTPKSGKGVLVYFLAAPQDQDVCEAIRKHLSPVVRTSKVPIEINSDFDIPSGEDIEKYKQRLYAADIVLSIISADFINDDSTYLRNQKVIERYNNRETVLVPILVRNCLWKSTPFVNLPLLPKNFQPLNNKQFWNSEDDALAAVVNELNDSIIEFTHKQALQAASAVESADALKIKSTSGTARIQKEGVTHLNVDWRKKHYKNVLWKRLAAIMLDQLILLFMPLCASIFFYFLMGGNNSATIDEFVGYFLVVMYFVISPLMESSRWRGTIGKRIMKLQITDKNGGRISFFRSLWRNILRSLVLYLYVLTFGVLLIVQYFTFRKTKKLFHDQLSNTEIGERL